MITKNLKHLLISFLVGFLFAVGLAISGMNQPAKVIGYLDFFGNWDPSLMFVMMGAIAVHAITYQFIIKRKTPILTAKFQVPQRKDLTSSLVIGSAIFGIGWGLGGYCPGPAIASFTTFSTETIILLISMATGMYLYKFVGSKLPFKK